MAYREESNVKVPPQVEQRRQLVRLDICDKLRDNRIRLGVEERNRVGFVERVKRAVGG